MLEIIDNRTLTEDAKVKLFTMALHKYQVTKDRLNWTEPMVVQLRDDSFAPAPTRTISDEMTASDLQLRENAEVNREIAGAPTPPLPTVARGKTGRKPSAKRSPAVAKPIAARKRPRIETEADVEPEPAPKKIRQDYLERLLGESPVLGPKRVIATAVFPILFF